MEIVPFGRKWVPRFAKAMQGEQAPFGSQTPFPERGDSVEEPMANHYRKLDDVAVAAPVSIPASPAPVAAPVSEPAAIPESLFVDPRVELVSAAIQKLFVAKGGADIELQIDLARQNVQNALACRRAEAARLAANPNAMREKGERPLVTVSEDRLHSRELTRLLDQRESLRLQCRNMIHETLHRMQPRTEQEWTKAIEAATRDIDDVGNMLAAGKREDEHREERLAVLKATTQFIKSDSYKLVDGVHREELAAALKKCDLQAIVQVFERLAPAARDAFDEQVRKQLGRAA